MPQLSDLNARKICFYKKKDNFATDLYHLIRSTIIHCFVFYLGTTEHYI